MIFQQREMAENVIGQYHLNEDQATALLSVARMFIDEETDGSPVSLIHGSIVKENLFKG